MRPPPPRLDALHPRRPAEPRVTARRSGRRSTRRRPAAPACARRAEADYLGDELDELRLVPERIEVRVFLREIAQAGALLERGPQVTDRILLAPEQRLAAGEVVERRGVTAPLERLARSFDHRFVLSGLEL